MLRQLRVPATAHGQLVVDDEARRPGRALVDREDHATSRMLRRHCLDDDDRTEQPPWRDAPYSTTAREHGRDHDADSRTAATGAAASRGTSPSAAEHQAIRDDATLALGDRSARVPERPRRLRCPTSCHANDAENPATAIPGSSG